MELNFEIIKTANNYGYDEIGNLKFDKVEGIDKIEWTAYGKVKSITRVDGYFKVVNNINVYPSNLEFLYDAMGNRIAKIEKPRDANGEKSAADWRTTYYIRDAQGNPMATYSRSSQNQEASYKLIERPIYGSSRVGIDNYSLELIDYTAPTNGITNHVLGLKQYELSNHLGNVLTTISDKKFPIDNNGLIDHYVADITSVSDYYPFGSPMDGRTFGSEKYRFGFNGQELDDEVAGNGNTNTALFWEYDTRLGRRWNIDPLFKDLPGISPYIFSYNSPLIFNDQTGKKGKVTIERNENGGGTITVSSTIYLFGLADNNIDVFISTMNNSAKTILTKGTYKDNKGNTWQIIYDLKFKSGKIGDTPEDKLFNNQLIVNNTKNQSSASTGEGFITSNVVKGVVKGNIEAIGTALEESIHFFGFGDQYDKVFEGLKTVIGYIAKDGFEDDVLTGPVRKKDYQFSPKHNQALGSYLEENGFLQNEALSTTRINERINGGINNVQKENLSNEEQKNIVKPF